MLAEWNLAEAHVSLCEDHVSVFLVTKFPDGAYTLARPDGPGPWAWYHDLFHSALAAFHGWPHSPALWRVAHPTSPDVCNDDFVAREEAAVLALQTAAQRSLAPPSNRG